MTKFLIKLDRLAGWILFIGMTLYFVTGYGMTKGIIDPQFSTSLHVDILIYLIFIAFFIHVPYATHLALKRWRFWNLFSQIIWLAIFLLLAYFIIFAEFIYKPKAVDYQAEETVIPSETDIINNDTDTQTTTTTDTKNNTSDTATNTDSSTTENTVKTFTVQELAQYDGKNGSRAYVAVDGNVYDLTNVFPNGFHYTHFAGKDLTNAFYSRHAASALRDYPIVGKLVK